MIDHKKVLVLALNGPAVGGGAAWFPGVADIVLAAESSWLQVPFSALGLVPEFGSATNFYHSIGAHRANDFLMFGRKVTAQEFEQWGLVNRILPTEGFHGKVVEFLEEQLSVNDGKSMMEAKRLQNLPLRRDRMLAVYDAAEALAERFVEDAPKQRFADKNKLLLCKSKTPPASEDILIMKQPSRRHGPSYEPATSYCQILLDPSHEPVHKLRETPQICEARLPAATSHDPVLAFSFSFRFDRRCLL